MKLDKTRELQAKSHELIPGGAHSYPKGDDQYPERALGFIARGQGCHVWDVDGNEFIEYAMGLRAVTLGHAYPEVVRATEQAPQSSLHRTGWAYAERVHRKLHRMASGGCLNEHLFCSVHEAQHVLEQWRQYYHHERPHSSLGGQTPNEFAQRLTS